MVPILAQNVPLIFLIFLKICLQEIVFPILLFSCVSLHFSLQIRSVVQLCPTLCDPMNRSMPDLPVHHQLPEFTQTHIRRVSDAIQPSHPLSSPSPPAPNPSQHPSFPMSWLFAGGGQSTGVSALASVLPKKSQGWSLEWTGWISLQSKGLSRVLSNTTAQKHHFFGAQPSSQSNSHIHTWPQEAFVISPCYSLELFIQTLHSVSPLLFTSLFFLAICKASSQPFCLLAFNFLWDGFGHHLLYNVMNLHPQFFRHSVYQI